LLKCKLVKRLFYVESRLRVNDSYSALLTPPFSLRFKDDFAGQAGVFGFLSEEKNGRLVVREVFPGYPAHQAGLRAGDIILSVDGVELDAVISNAEGAMLIKGPAGKSAHFVVQRGDEVFEFDAVRKKRTLVSARMLSEEIGYIAQYTFATDATQEVRVALQELLAQNPKGLIWDLSLNEGGSMEAAQEILSYFIEDGLLFTAELKGGQQKPFLAEGEVIAADVPLVVLVGERTASAAETAAAAIAERDRGVLIGGTTYGKATIQAMYPLGEGVLLQMTIAKWLSPTGQWYHGRGITPHVTVSDDESTKEDELLQFAVAYLIHRVSP
jgi:carboxyl-terminal processing protease